VRTEFFNKVYQNSNFRLILNIVCFFLGNFRSINFICRRFGTLCLFHLHRQVGVKNELGLRIVGVYTGKGLARK